jgi:anti-anti-sigma regulatory factor
MLTESVKRQRERGVTVWLVGMNPHVLEMVQRSRLGEMLAHDATHFNLETALATYLDSARTSGNPS